MPAGCPALASQTPAEGQCLPAGVWGLKPAWQACPAPLGHLQKCNHSTCKETQETCHPQAGRAGGVLVLGLQGRDAAAGPGYVLQHPSPSLRIPSSRAPPWPPSGLLWGHGSACSLEPRPWISAGIALLPVKHRLLRKTRLPSGHHSPRWVTKVLGGAHTQATWKKLCVGHS